MKLVSGEDFKFLETELAKNVINHANTALYKAKDIKNEFAQILFKMDFERVDDMFKTDTFYWLPVLDTSNVSKINSRSFTGFLPKLYSDVQIIAAGIDLVFANEKYETFKDIKAYLKLVLSEIFTVIYECHLTLPSDITREIIPTDCVSMVDQTAIKARDWIIFREYVNMMEYIIKVFRNHTPNVGLIIKNLN